MSVSFEEREQLRQMLGFEKTMNEFSLKTGWYWGDVQIATQEINKLLLKHLVRVALATNSGTGYRVTDEGRLAAEEKNFSRSLSHWTNQSTCCYTDHLPSRSQCFSGRSRKSMVLNACHSLALLHHIPKCGICLQNDIHVSS